MAVAPTDWRRSTATTTSLDQYAATMGGWFGVSDGGPANIFPNLANFAPQRLAFL